MPLMLPIRLTSGKPRAYNSLQPSLEILPRESLLESLHEACGVFGVYAPSEDVARVTFFGLYAMQHRGQESAGIATTDGDGIKVRKDMGLVSQVFQEEDLLHLQGFAAIGHTRYSTTGSSRIENAQPFVMDGPNGATWRIKEQP